MPLMPVPGWNDQTHRPPGSRISQGGIRPGVGERTPPVSQSREDRRYEKLTATASRSAGSSISKNSRSVKLPMLAMMFEGTDWIFVL